VKQKNKNNLATCSCGHQGKAATRYARGEEMFGINCKLVESTRSGLKSVLVFFNLLAIIDDVALARVVKECYLAVKLCRRGMVVLG
jgi:hypothetical protein